MAIEVQIQKKLGKYELDIDWKSEKKRIGILGASGSGKSLTLKCIAGIEKPDSGKIMVGDQIFYDGTKKIHVVPQKRGIGYMFQNYALFPTMTVEKNIAAGLKCSKKEQKARVEEMIERFRLQGLERRLPKELSGGQQQRVALARIMAYEPSVILLDEPFSALDVFLKDRLQQEMMELLEDYEGVVILVSHSRDEIYRFSEEILVIDEGKQVCFGNTRETFAMPKEMKTARLTGCKNIVPVVRVSEHKIEVPDWGVTFYMEKAVPEETKYIGVRAREFIPIWGETEENCIPAHIKEKAEFPFEWKYFVKGATETCEDICWYVQSDKWKILEEKGLPDYLKLPEDKIMLLV